MRILLAANASYIPPRGGATRSNLIWLDHLAGAGHECRIVCAALPPERRRDQMRQEEIRVEAERVEDGVEISRRGAIEVRAAADPVRRAAELRRQIREFRPDWVLISSEDLGHVLLREASLAAPGRVVYLAHTPQFYPFGPASWNPDPRAAELVARAAAVVAIGRSTAGYIERHTGRAAAVVHPPIYGQGPYRNLACFDRGLVTMINPCAMKGIDIFLALAARLPDISFGALEGWGTTAPDRAALAALPNIELLPNCRDIEQVLERTRVLLMPSLWLEGFGLIVMEAMLRGIPVVSSDSGGLEEAKAGTGYVIPVRPIERFEPVFDEHGMPRPVTAPQEIAPWVEAVRTLTGNRDAYESESRASRDAALRFTGGLRAGAIEELLAGLAPGKSRRGLRILLAQNSLYYPAHGGGDKSNRLLIEALAARGHACRVVARVPVFGREQHERYLADLAARGVEPDSTEQGIVVFHRNGVEVHVATDHPHLRAYFASQVEAFDPGVIVASTDDPAQLLLEAALRAERARVVYLVRATLAVPFGPDCAFPSAARTEMLRRADAVVGVSQYVADYIRAHAGIPAVHVPISLLEPGEYPQVGRFENEFVTLVNPCAVKGIGIFLALADAMPETAFAAVPTWGTNAQDRAALAARPNITLLDPVDDIDLLLARTRVLLVPSLWAEARSRIIPEAMARGVPVVASRVGGIPEAKMGVDYLLPVRPIERYQARVDEQMVPVAEVPPQDIGPWLEAVRRLTGDRAHWEEISRQSRRAALAYAANLSAEPFERLLEETVAAPKRAPAAAAAQPETARQPLDRLSPEKRRLLALMLRRKTAGPAWFPGIESAAGARVRLFCFPHAGGGAAAFRKWHEALPEDVAVCPVRLPGRENRASEAPFTRMEALVEALFDVILPHLSGNFALFGHSMGAGVAFELARMLRRRGAPLPSRLLVSGARAPQYRLNRPPPPEPGEAELREQLRRLEGIPPEALENEDVMRLLAPALRADTGLYRAYTYREEPPLACPISAYGGEADPGVACEHLEAWSRQTTAAFRLRLFPGGHFYLQGGGAADFLSALARDLD